MALHFVSTILVPELLSLCVFCIKLAQGPASMYYIIHVEHQQGIHIYMPTGTPQLSL